VEEELEKEEVEVKDADEEDRGCEIKLNHHTHQQGTCVGTYLSGLDTT
jgi:hypothetical protein